MDLCEICKEKPRIDTKQRIYEIGGKRFICSGDPEEWAKKGFYEIQEKEEEPRYND